MATTCCTLDEHLLLFRASDGSLLSVSSYPNSENGIDKFIRTFAFFGVDKNGFYQVILDSRQKEASVFVGYYIFSARFTIPSLSSSLPTIVWNKESMAKTLRDRPMGLIVDSSGSSVSL